MRVMPENGPVPSTCMRLRSTCGETPSAALSAPLRSARRTRSAAARAAPPRLVRVGDDRRRQLGDAADQYQLGGGELRLRAAGRAALGRGHARFARLVDRKLDHDVAHPQ